MTDREGLIRRIAYGPDMPPEQVGSGAKEAEAIREALRYGRPVGMGSNEQALAALDFLLARLEAVSSENELLRGEIEAALRELERAKDVRTSRIGIIGNVDLILRAAAARTEPAPLPPT